MLWYDTFCNARIYGRGMTKIYGRGMTQIQATISYITFDTEEVAKKFINMLCCADVKRRVDVLTFAGIYDGEYDFYAQRREAKLPKAERSLNYRKSLIVPGQFDIVEVT